jgi:hypothetical protein
MNNAKAVETYTSSIAINPRYNIENIDYASQFNGGGTYQDVSRVWNYPLYFLL